MRTTLQSALEVKRGFVSYAIALDTVMPVFLSSYGCRYA